MQIFEEKSSKMRRKIPNVGVNDGEIKDVVRWRNGGCRTGR